MSEYISSYTGKEIDDSITLIEELNNRIDDIEESGLATNIQIISFNGTGQPFIKTFTLSFVPTIVKLYYASSDNEDVCLCGIYKPDSISSMRPMTSLWQGKNSSGFSFTPNTKSIQFTGGAGYYVLEAIR